MVERVPQEKYQQIRQVLNEKQWRQYLALQAKELGSIAHLARQAGVSRNTIYRGIREIESEDIYSPGQRIRKRGAGKKKFPIRIRPF